MGKLFHRELPLASPFDALLDRMSASGDEAHAAIARNFRCDHRVSGERQAEFDTGLTPTPDVHSFEVLVKSYYDQHVKTPPGPRTAFLLPANRNNWAYGAAGSVPPLPGHIELATCLDLTGLHGVLIAARDTYARPHFSDLTDPYPAYVEDSDEVYEWHRRRMRDPHSLETRTHIDEVLGALAEHIDRDNHYHPTWATFWDEYRNLVLSSNPNLWLAFLGVSRCFRAHRWLILLRYRVDDVGTLVRPTVLDAGWYPFHFPSPPQSGLERGGHPVNLSPHAVPRLLSEFIHAQIKFSVGHWETAENIIGSTEVSPQPPSVIKERRKAHHQSLVDHRGVDVTVWMDDPN